MLGLQAEDPRVDEVFGTEYAGRLRELQHNAALLHTRQARRPKKNSARRKTGTQGPSFAAAHAAES